MMNQDWRQNYAQWAMQIGQNAMEGSNTGPTSTPQGMYGQQHFNQPQDFNGNALMQPQNMEQGSPYPPPMVNPGQGLQQNAIFSGVNRMLG